MRSMLKDRPLNLKVSRQNHIRCTALSYGRLRFLTLDAQPEEAQLDAHFPISQYVRLHIYFA